jgi:sulfoxide reductase heme-binding subunit YedZ
MDASPDQPADTTLAAQFGLPALALVAALVFAVSGAGANTVWYVVRATGVVAYGLITLTVVGGLLVSNRSLPAGRPRVDVYEAHRFVSLLAISAAGFHAVTLLLDSYIGFSPSQILVPFTSSYRPVAVALGIMALYGAIAIYVSFYLKRWTGHAAWRAIHYGSFAIFALASYHGILSGADTSRPWMLALYLGAIAAVVSLLMYRIVKTSAVEATKATPVARAGRDVSPAPSRAAGGRGREGAASDLAWKRQAGRD